MRLSQSSKPPPKDTSLAGKLAKAPPEKRREIVEEIEAHGTEAQKAALKKVPKKYKT